MNNLSEPWFQHGLQVTIRGPHEPFIVSHGFICAGCGLINTAHPKEFSSCSQFTRFAVLRYHDE